MTALINLLGPADRERLLSRLAELDGLRRLAEAPPEPPDPITSNDTTEEPAP